MHIDTLLEQIFAFISQIFLLFFPSSTSSLPFTLLKHTSSKSVSKASEGQSERKKIEAARQDKTDKGGKKVWLSVVGEHSLAYNLTSKTQSRSVDKTLVLGGSC